MTSIQSEKPYIIKKIKSQSAYKARNWNREDAFRYIFSISGDILEGAFFIHYENDNVVKHVVELPVSYGCPIECKHCASGVIKKVKQLNHDEIYEMFIIIVTDNTVGSDKPILITYSGIGEGALQKKNLEKASKKIFSVYRKSYFNLSTVGYDSSFIKFCEILSSSIPLHHIQITYLHHDLSKVVEIIPNAKKLKFNFKELINAIDDSKYEGTRLNYVLIKGYNDKMSDLDQLLKILEQVKNKIVIRISKLNDTEVSLKNGLSQPEYSKLELFKKLIEEKGFKTHIFTPETNNNMNCGQLSWNYTENVVTFNKSITQ